MDTFNNTILVTGASGFLAQHIILQLLNLGYRIKGTVRTQEKAEVTRKTLLGHSNRTDRLTFCSTNLLSDDGWANAMKGCSYVIHTASPIPSILPKNPNDLIIPARDGTLRVLKFAAQASVKRVIMTSSVASVMYGNSLSNPDGSSHTFTEKDWTDDTNMQDSTAYIRSKAIAEKEAWRFIHQEAANLQLTTILPSAMMGPVLSNDFSTSVEIVTQTMSGKLPAAPNLGYQMVDVRDVAAAHILAMELEQAAGERFIVADEFLWFIDVCNILRENFPNYSRIIPKRKMPSFVLRILAWFNPVMKQVVLELDKKRLCSSQKARTELGWNPRSATEAITSTANSLIQLGLFKV